MLRGAGVISSVGAIDLAVDQVLPIWRRVQVRCAPGTAADDQADQPMGAENVRTILALSPLSRATRLLTGDVVAVPTPKDLLMAIALTGAPSARASASDDCTASAVYKATVTRRRGQDDRPALLPRR